MRLEASSVDEGDKGNDARLTELAASPEGSWVRECRLDRLIYWGDSAPSHLAAHGSGQQYQSRGGAGLALSPHQAVVRTPHILVRP